jgi:hypothetical protein
MTISIPALVVIVLAILVVVALIGRSDRPPMTPTRAFWIAAAVAFALACVAVPSPIPLVPLGLFLYVCGYLVSPR